MKILRIIARLNVGGPARHVVWLTTALQTNEFESTLIAGIVPVGEADMAYFAAENGVEPIYIPELSRELSLRDIVSLFKIFNEIRRQKPDIIHTHTAKAGTVGRAATFLYRWLTFGTLIGRPRKVKVVHTFHGHVFHGYYGKLKTRFFIAIEKLLARIATDRIVVISDQQFHEIHEVFGVGRGEQFAIVPLGIDLGESADMDPKRNILRSEIAAAEDEIIVGFIGRLTEIKNLPMLLAVATRYQARSDADNPKLRFVIIGDGHLRVPLEAESGELGRLVTFLGHRPDVADLISGLDIVALTSRNEGTPLSLIEAMAAGKPVIATSVGGVVDLLGQTTEQIDGFRICERGIAVDPDDAEQFLNGLIYLAKSEKLHEMLAAAGGQFVMANYSKVRLVTDIEGLYRELVIE